MTDEGQSRIEFLVVADRAEVSEGKLYMMGGCWDRLSIPAVDPEARVEVGIAMRALVSPMASETRHHIELRVDGPGVPSIVPSGFEFIRNPQSTDVAGLLPVLVATQCFISVKEAGIHVIEALLDGRPAAQARFLLVVGGSDNAAPRTT